MHYREVDNIIGRTGYGNHFSGDNSRNTSYFVIRKLEAEALGVMIRASISRKIVQQATLAFVNDTNLYSNKLRCNEMIQQSVNVYTRLFEVTGGAIQQGKSYCYGWKWEEINGIEQIVDFKIEVKIHSKRLK